jgi:hypothetical protein
VIARDLPARTPEEVARLVRALGSHRYVAGRLLLVHAFVFDAVRGASLPDISEAATWAADTLGAAGIDAGSRDERLFRRSTERELGAALSVFWTDEPEGQGARRRLEERLRSIGASTATGPLFDEGAEGEIFPVLVDAGWELLPLGALDPERHRGAMDAFGDPFAFDCAKFEEEAAKAGGNPLLPLQELPALGAAELLHGAEHAILRAPFVLWTEGNATYHDYVLRGVLRAAKLD